MSNLDREKEAKKASRATKIIDAFLKVAVILTMGFGAIILLGYIDVRVGAVQENAERERAALLGQIAEIRANSTTAQLTLNRLLVAEAARSNETASQFQALAAAIEGYVSWKTVMEQEIARMDSRIRQLEVRVGVRVAPLDLLDSIDRAAPAFQPLD